MSQTRMAAGRLRVLAACLGLLVSHPPLAASNPLPTPTDQEASKGSDRRTAKHIERERVRLREQAQDIAVQVAQEKMNTQLARERHAQRQLQLARERQLKALYQKGLAFYQKGMYEEAMEIWQQMPAIDPTHQLVRAARRHMTEAQVKRFEQQAKAGPGTAVSDLERLLIEKRIELETTLKYARQALRERRYVMASDMFQQVLVQDPDNREASRGLKEAQLARLADEEAQLEKQVELDEQQMMNEVLKAELLNPPGAAPPSGTVRSAAALDEAQATILRRLQEPISFDFQDVAFGDVLDFLAQSANVSIIPSPRIDLEAQRVSFKVDQLPMGLALKYLVQNQGLVFRLDDEAIVIANPNEFEAEPMETRVFLLRSGLGPYALETSAVESNPVLAMDSIKELILQAIAQPSGSKLVIDERTGSLIMTNTTDNVRKVERLLSQLDIAPLQILIEARFVELTVTDLEHLGFEAILNADTALTKKGDRDGTTRGTGNQLNKASGFKFPSLSRETEALNLTLQGVLSGTQFEAVLHALEESKKSKTLSAPRVTTLNNQTASIKIVEEFRYPTRYEVSLVQFDINGDGDFDDAGETQFVNVPQDFQKRDVGILLNVTPSVGRDLKTVTLVLAPEVSQFSQFRDLGGDVTVPEFTSSQLTTSVVMQDGQTVVLGGLMKDSLSETITKVPFFGDLPLVGPLFRQREESQTKKSLIIFVTARLLTPRGETI